MKSKEEKKEKFCGVESNTRCCYLKLCPIHSPAKEGKYCVESSEYGKDELKRLHFYCKNCGKEILLDKQICPVKEKPVENWEERFDKEFVEGKNYIARGNMLGTKERLKSFIAHEISAAEIRGYEKGYDERGVLEAEIKDMLIRKNKQ